MLSVTEARAHTFDALFLLGVGRGISPYEVAYYGIDPAESQARYIEALDLTSGKRTRLILANSSPLFAPPGLPLQGLSSSVLPTYAASARPNSPLMIETSAAAVFGGLVAAGHNDLAAGFSFLVFMA